jgi:hypothetical protein
LIDVLAQPENLKVLRDGLFAWLNRWVRAAGEDRRVRSATIDIDSFKIEVHGGQEGAAYNGHYQAVVYHPIVASFCVGGSYDVPVTVLGWEMGF